MKNDINRLQETLPEGFRIRTIRNEEDSQKAIQLNALIHGNDTEELVRGLCTRHPTMRLQDCFFVEEEATGRMVSFLCLIPLKWSYEGVELKVAELGCVGTLEAYRRRGFIR
ncbi:MAG: GNAT family N-acetyltransferase, partial [Candidatus Bathyarchaeia archaeon]